MSPIHRNDTMRSARHFSIISLTTFHLGPSSHNLLLLQVDDSNDSDRLALFWMNEEWYNDRRHEQSNPKWVSQLILIIHQRLTGSSKRLNYEIWLLKLVSVYEPQIDAKDRTLSRFLLDIPHIPSDILNTLRELCTEPDR